MGMSDVWKQAKKDAIADVVANGHVKKQVEDAFKAIFTKNLAAALDAADTAHKAFAKLNAKANADAAALRKASDACVKAVNKAHAICKVYQAEIKKNVFGGTSNLAPAREPLKDGIDDVIRQLTAKVNEAADAV